MSTFLVSKTTNLSEQILFKNKKVVCVGGGVIGSGWAARFALHGIDVTIVVVLVVVVGAALVDVFLLSREFCCCWFVVSSLVN